MVSHQSRGVDIIPSTDYYETKSVRTMSDNLDGYKILYLTYKNDYLTIGKFAEDHNITLDVANNIINIGRALCTSA